MNCWKSLDKALSLSNLRGLILFLFLYLAFSLLFLVAAHSLFLNSPDYASCLYAALTLPLSIATLVYTKLAKGRVSERLYLSRKNLTLKGMAYGSLLLVIMLLLSISLTILFSLLKISIKTNASILLAGVPAWFYLYIVIIEPINEEFFFRAFLVPRIGIIFSAMLFGAAHMGSGFTFQIDAFFALVFGLLGGYILKKTRSLYPVLAAHILFNLINVAIYIL